MTGKRKTFLLICIILAVALTGVCLAAAKREKGKDVMTQLTDSIHYENGKLSFTIPEESADWNIQISGRVAIDKENGMSVHYLEEESQNFSWESGKTYSFDVSGGGYTELFLQADDGSQNILVDLLQWLPAESAYDAAD